jgi:hypothetical protein
MCQSGNLAFIASSHESIPASPMYRDDTDRGLFIGKLKVSRSQL